MFIDEHEKSIQQSAFGINVPNKPLFGTSPWDWISFPATRHNNGCSLTFADGHAETWRWKEARTMEISNMPGWLSWPPHASLGAKDRDFSRVVQGVPEKVPVL